MPAGRVAAEVDEHRRGGVEDVRLAAHHEAVEALPEELSAALRHLEGASTKAAVEGPSAQEHLVADGDPHPIAHGRKVRRPTVDDPMAGVGAEAVLHRALKVGEEERLVAVGVERHRADAARSVGDHQSGPVVPDERVEGTRRGGPEGERAEGVVILRPVDQQDGPPAARFEQRPREAEPRHPGAHDHHVVERPGRHSIPCASSAASVSKMVRSIPARRCSAARATSGARMERAISTRRRVVPSAAGSRE